MDDATFDKHISQCGAHADWEKGCRRPSVVRMMVHTFEYDYVETDDREPYVGTEVWVELCAEHKADVEQQVVDARKRAEEREAAVAAKQAEVDKLKEQLAEAESELRYL